MKIVNTADPMHKPSIVMLVYGEGGVGKTTFGSTAPNPLLLDFENGSKYFGLRGISIDTVQIVEWSRWKTAREQNPDLEGTMRDPELIEIIRSEKYNTIVVDPIGEAMEKIIKSVATHPDTKMRQKDGSPTMAGWGYVKNTMREFIKFLRDSGKHVIFIGHVEEKDDDGRMVKRPLIATKISQEFVNMVDIVGYMTTKDVEGETVRTIIVDPSNDRITAKDRTGKLGTELEPDFTQIVTALHGDETYDWQPEEDTATPPDEDTQEPPQEDEAQPEADPEPEVQTEAEEVTEDSNESVTEESATIDPNDPEANPFADKKADAGAKLDQINKKKNGATKK